MIWLVLKTLGRLFRKIAVFSILASSAWTAIYKLLNSLTAKMGPKMGLFGRKTAGSRKENVIFFRAFLLLRGL